jgi:hypothetical protein
MMTLLLKIDLIVMLESIVAVLPFGVSTMVHLALTKLRPIFQG